MSKKLFLQAFGKFFAGLILVMLLLFLPAGTLRYWNAWLFIAILFIPMFIAGIVLMFINPELLAKRLSAKETQSEQKLAELDALLVTARKEAAGMEDYLEKVSNLLPEDMTLEEDRITWTEPLDNRNLECIVQLLPPGEEQRTKWISHKLIVDEPEDDWEW